ncbi:MAG: transglycosylase SLT domain-containing protein [Thermodesulfobacteriota bacterium]
MVKLFFPAALFASALFALCVFSPPAVAGGYEEKLGNAYRAVKTEPEKSLSLLYDLENKIPELKEYVFFIRGLALDEQGNALAADMYRIAAASKALKADALEKQADALEKNGHFADASGIYKKLMKAGAAKKKAVYLKKLAEIEEKSGRKSKAADIWERIWKEYPASSEGGEAPEKIAALRGSFAPDEKDLAERADGFFKRKKCGRALSEYKKLPETPQRNLRRAVCIYRTSRKNARMLKKALALVEKPRSAEAGYRKGLILERIAKISGSERRRKNNLRKAARVYRATHKNFPEDEWTGKSLLKEQAIAVRLVGAKEVEKIYFIIRKHHPAHLEEAAWNAGWAYYADGNYKKAAEIFSANRREKRPFLRGQFVYWRARILEKAGKKTEAEKLFSEVAARRFSYYSYLASERTGHNLFSVPAKLVRRKSPGLKRARLLIKAGLTGWAKTEAKLVARKRPAEACAILAGTGNFSFCISLAGLEPEPGKMRLAFPEGFKNDVKKQSKKQGLDENLVYSLIREESRFVQNAVSHADAHGLMQLLVSTAKDMAEEDGVSEVTPRKLFGAELNIKLGSRYLSAMLKKFGGKTAVALAAYNAGPSRVKSWVEGPLKNLEPDEFTESIPFEETRDYVRRIFRSCGAYIAVYKSD